MESGFKANGDLAAGARASCAPRRRGGTKRWDRLPGISPAAQRLEAMIVRAASVDSTVLVAGETGVGKEEIVRAIHACGRRASRPLIAVNCGAMAPSLIESQLFGHEKGSFTGAVGPSLGVFRAADGGTVFLDEIGEMPLELQPRLLRVLQEREVMPTGSTAVHPVDVHVIAATNRCLYSAVRAGTFREDLYFRINTIEIEVPPLRDRCEDIPLLVGHFCRHFAARFAAEEWRPDAATLDRLARYHWPGNVRQLAQAVERVYAVGDLPALPDDATTPSEYRPTVPRLAILEADDEPVGETPLPALDLETLRHIAVRQALAVTNGHKGKAAALLGVHINTMTKLVDEVIPALSRRRVQKPR